MAQKAIQSNKGKEVAIFMYSSKTKKKDNKNKGKISVVKPKGGIAKNKGKAIVREEQDKRKYFYC